MEIRVIIAYRPAEYPSYYIPGAGIGGQLPVGNGEADGTDMICNYPECDRFPAVAKIICPAGDLFGGGYSAGKNICVIIGLFVLQHPYQPLKPHTRIYMPGWQGVKASVL